MGQNFYLLVPAPQHILFLIEGSKAKFKICNYKFEAQNFRIDESKNSTLCNDDSKSYKFQILQFLNLVDYKKNYKN